MKTLSRFLDATEKVTKFICKCMMLFILVLTLYQIFGRYLFSLQVWWAEQVCRYVFIWMMMLYLPIPLRHEQNLGFDMIVNKFKPIVKDTIWLICNVLMGLFGGCYCYYTILLCTQYYKLNKIFEGLNWHCWWLYLAQAIAGLFLAISAVEVSVKIIRRIKDDKKGVEEV